MNKPILTTITIITVCLAATVLAGIYYFAPEQGDNSAINKIPTQNTGYVQPNYESLLEQIKADRAADKAYYDEELRKANDEIAELKSRPTQITTVVEQTGNENLDSLIARLNEQDAIIKKLEENVYKYYNIILKEQADQNVKINDNYNYILADEKVAMSYYKEIIESLEKCKSSFVTLEKLQNSQDEQDNKYSSIINHIQEQIDELKSASKKHMTLEEIQNIQDEQDNKYSSVINNIQEQIDELKSSSKKHVILEKLQSSQDEQDNKYSSVVNHIQEQIDELKSLSKKHVTQDQLKEIQDMISTVKEVEKSFAYVDPYHPQNIDEVDEYKNQRLKIKYTVLNRLLNSLHEEDQANDK